MPARRWLALHVRCCDAAILMARRHEGATPGRTPCRYMPLHAVEFRYTAPLRAYSERFTSASHLFRPSRSRSPPSYRPLLLCVTARMTSSFPTRSTRCARLAPSCGSLAVVLRHLSRLTVCDRSIHRTRSSFSRTCRRTRQSSTWGPTRASTATSAACPTTRTTSRARCASVRHRWCTFGVFVCRRCVPG